MRKEMKVLLSTVAIAALLAGCGQATTTKKSANSSSNTQTAQTTKNKKTTKEAKKSNSSNESTKATTASASTKTPQAAATLAAGSEKVQAKAAASKANTGTSTAKTVATYEPVTKTLTVTPTANTNTNGGNDQATVTNPTNGNSSTTTNTGNNPTTTQTTEEQQPTLVADQLTQNQKYGLYVWYTSKHVTNEATPTTERPLTVTIMNESSVMAPLPNGTNNTYYQIYGSTADDSEWVNYYAQGKDISGIDQSVYVYNDNQWNKYQLSDMTNTANQEQGSSYVNDVANNVQTIDER